MTTEWSGFLAMMMGIPVSAEGRASRPCRRAPPPVSTMPCSMMSAANSGGVLSRVTLTASTMAETGSSTARLISSVEVTMVLGRPVTRSRPRISACSSSSSGHAEPRAILISSDVRSPRARLYSFLMYWMMASSSSSPPMRIDWLVTIPPREMTAVLGVDGDDGRFVQDDAPPPDVHEGVGRAEIDRHVPAEQGGEEAVGHAKVPPP